MGQQPPTVRADSSRPSSLIAPENLLGSAPALSVQGVREVFFVAAGTVERFTDAGGLLNGLFKVRLDILGATPAARQGGAVFPHPRPEHARARLSRRQAAGRALRRYCSGCARETEQSRGQVTGRRTLPRSGGRSPNRRAVPRSARIAARFALPPLGRRPRLGRGGPRRRVSLPRGGMASRQSRCRLRRPTREPPRPPGERVEPPRPESPSQAKASSCAHGLTSAPSRLRRRAPSFGARAEQRLQPST